MTSGSCYLLKMGSVDKVYYLVAVVSLCISLCASPTSSTLLSQFSVKLFSLYFFIGCSCFVHHRFLIEPASLVSPKVWVNRSASSGSGRYFHVGSY